MLTLMFQQFIDKQTKSVFIVVFKTQSENL